MPKITILPIKSTVELTEGQCLLDAIHAINIDFESACGGSGTCGKCIVKIISGKVDFKNNGSIDKNRVDEGYVLACLTTVLSDPIVLEIPRQILLKGGKFAELEDETAGNQPGISQVGSIKGFVSKCALTVSAPKLEDGLSDLDRLSKAIHDHIASNPIHYPLNIIRKIAELLRLTDGKIVVLYFIQFDVIYIIDLISPSDAEEYGLAIDIGTTTVAVQLVYISTGKILGTYSDYNDQIKCGQDVISRINYANRKEGLKELQNRIIVTLNHLIHSLCEKYHVNSNQIYSSVISGNTTMIHLLLGLLPEYIRLDPYTPTILSVPNYLASDVGININPNAVLYFSPAVGSYVGGDITAGLLCTTLDKGPTIDLFIDIGTNGELVIGNQDFLMTCACSAGPAFEGAGLDYGMRAVKGAIDNVTVDKHTGAIKNHVIGACDPEGICGSGVISLLAQLFLTGWLDASGKFDRNRISKYIEISGRNAKYIIVPAEESALGNAITISETEITNILRAKAAIYSAISLILKNIDLTVDQLGTVFIGGNFGRYMNLEDAITIGLLPDLPLEKFKYLGNSSLFGSYLLLISEENRQRQKEFSHKMTYIELNTDLTYMDQYTAALFIPHTDIIQFPSVQKRKMLQ